LRVSLDELASLGGLGPEELIPMVVGLADQCDLVTVGIGSIFTRSAFRPDFHSREAFNNQLSRRLRDAANGKFATYLQGSVTQIAIAESVCEGGDADGVEMTRALITDANLINKVQAGEDPIGCVLCNQACLVEDASNPIISCQLNPDAGYELEPTPKGFFQTRLKPT
ncbi:oxidoreductase, FMN-binding/pyridine nucleotide-disulfide oxidoreductase, partial [mine drainage metagenome]